MARQPHDSVCYDGDFLAAYAVPTPMLAMPEPTIWDAASLEDDVVRIAHRGVIEDNGMGGLLDIISKNGFAVVTGTPRIMDAVSDLTDRIGYGRQTIFGGLWEFEANENMADSAYTPKNSVLIRMVHTVMTLPGCKC